MCDLNKISINLIPKIQTLAVKYYYNKYIHFYQMILYKPKYISVCLETPAPPILCPRLLLDISLKQLYF